jgi:transposase
MSAWRRRDVSFTAEYRVEAAHRVIDTGRTIVEVARDLGMSEQQLGRWVNGERVRQAAADAAPLTPPLTESERAELARSHVCARRRTPTRRLVNSATSPTSRPGQNSQIALSGDARGTSSCVVAAYLMVITTQRAVGFGRRAHVATSIGWGR